MYIQALQDKSFSGGYNATAPNPVRMSELCSSLGGQLGRPSWLPVPDFALQVKHSPHIFCTPDYKGMLYKISRDVLTPSTAFLEAAVF